MTFLLKGRAEEGKEGQRCCHKRINQHGSRRDLSGEKKGRVGFPEGGGT